MNFLDSTQIPPSSIPKAKQIVQRFPITSFNFIHRQCDIGKFPNDFNTKDIQLVLSEKDPNKLMAINQKDNTSYTSQPKDLGGSYYLIFVKQEDEIKVVPVSKWHEFTKDFKGKIYSLEEAEHMMDPKFKPVPTKEQSVQNKLETNTKGYEEKEEEKEKTGEDLIQDIYKLNKRELISNRKKVRNYEKNKEDLDFDENEKFEDDDEEAFLPFQEDVEIAQNSRASKFQLGDDVAEEEQFGYTESGRNLFKILVDTKQKIKKNDTHKSDSADLFGSESSEEDEEESESDEDDISHGIEESRRSLTKEDLKVNLSPKNPLQFKEGFSMEESKERELSPLAGKRVTRTPVENPRLAGQKSKKEHFSEFGVIDFLKKNKKIRLVVKTNNKNERYLLQEISEQDKQINRQRMEIVRKVCNIMKEENEVYLTLKDEYRLQTRTKYFLGDK